MAPIFDLSNIVAGIILAAPTIQKIQGVGGQFSIFVSWLRRYQIVIGALSFLLGLYFLFRQGYLVHDLVGICVGIVLLKDNLSEFPFVGVHLEKFCELLTPLNQAIGILAILVGLLGFFNIGVLA